MNGITQRRTCGICCFILLLFGMIAPAAGPQRPDYVPGEVLISYKASFEPAIVPPGSSRTSAMSYDAKALRLSNPILSQAFDRHGLISIEPIVRPSSARGGVRQAVSPGAHRLIFPPDANVNRIASELAQNPHVRYAEPNYLGTLCFAPSDPLYTNQSPDLALLGLEDGWQAQISGGDAAGADPAVLVAVIDSGAELNHPDLQAIDAGKSFNFVEGNNNIADDIGHGTRVAGIIGATAGNGEGIAGVAFGCTLMVLDVADPNGSVTISNVASAINFAAAEGADIINLSLGFKAFSNTLKETCDEAAAAGVLIIASAGNENQGDQAVYPASYPSVMGVGAIMDDGSTRASFSNYNGKRSDLVDIVAPGVTIYSTIPGFQYNGTYGSGTSFSAPMAAGIAALLKTQNPSQSGAALRAHLLSTASALPAFLPLGGAGAGLLNAHAALATPMAPNVSIASITVDDSPSYNPSENDGDGVLDAGETARLIVKLKAQGADAHNVSAILSTNDGDLSAIANDSATIGDVRVGTLASNAADPFADLIVSPATGVKTIAFDLALAGDGGFSQMLNFTLGVEDETDIAGVHVDTTFTSDTTYHVTANLLFQGTTIIEPGTTFKVDPGVIIRHHNGSLQAVGTETDKITFTSSQSSHSLLPGSRTSTAHGVGPQTEPVDFERTDTAYFWVDGNVGSDSAAGTAANPFATIQKAASVAITPATPFRAIIVAEGVYAGTGTAVAQLAIRTRLFGGFQSGTWQRDILEHQTILDAEFNRNGVSTGGTLCTVDGIVVINSGSFKPLTTLFASQSTFSNLVMEGDIDLPFAQNTKLRNSVLNSNIAIANSPSDDPCIVSQNIIIGSISGGPRLNIERNFFLKSTSSAISLGVTSTQSAISNNVIASASANAVSITGLASSINLLNNTILSNGGTGFFSVTPVNVINNIFWNNAAQVAAPGGSVIDHNIIQGGYSGSGDTNTIVNDPDIEKDVLIGLCVTAAYNASRHQTELAISQEFLPGALAGEIMWIGDVPFYVLKHTSNTVTVAGDLTAHGILQFPVPFVLRTYRITSAGSTAVGNGVGPAANALIPILDLDGELRSGISTDIGADLYNPITVQFKNWGRFEVFSGVTTATLSHVLFSDGAGLLIEHPNTAISDIEVRDSNGYGIKATTALSMSASNLIARRNIGHGIDLPGTDVSGSIAEINGGDGIRAVEVTNSSAADNSNRGIAATSATNSTAIRSGLDGLVLSSGGESLLAQQNGGGGIVTTGGDIEDSQSYENGGIGISISGGGHATGCTASFNFGNGISTDGSIVDQCIARENGGYGVAGAGSSTLANSRVIGNAIGAISGVATVNNSAIASNGAGIANAASISSAYIAHNIGNGVFSGGAIADSSIIGNGGHGVNNFASITNSWIANNASDGLRSAPETGTGDFCAVIANGGVGTHNILSLNNSNLHGNVVFDARDVDTAGNADRDFSGNWWGTANASEISGRIRDFLDSSGNHLIVYSPHAASPVGNAPGLAPPAFLLSVAPDLSEPVLVGPQVFTLTFSEAMATSASMAVTFGTIAPYATHVIEPAGGWVAPNRWEGIFWVQSDTGDGLNTLHVSGAIEANGFLLPDDTAHQFMIDGDTPGGANAGIASATGSNGMKLQWEPYIGPPAPIAGYNIRRSLTGDGNFVRINSSLVTDLEFQDNGLQPATTYHYIVDSVDVDSNAQQSTAPFNGTTLPVARLEEWILY